MDVIRDMAPPPKTGTFSSVFKHEPPSVDLKLPTNGENITLVEICTFFPYWLKNGDVATRFFLGELNRTHIAKIIDHHCDLDRDQISPNLLTHWLNGGLRHVTGKEKWTYANHAHTLDRSNYDSRNLTLTGAKLNCEYSNAYSSRIKVPSVLFRSLGDHVRTIPQGFDRLDITRCVEYAIDHPELELRFPRDFGALIDVLGKAPVELDHFDFKVAERWAQPRKNANRNQLQGAERSGKRRASRHSIVTDGGNKGSNEQNHPAPAVGSSSMSHLRMLMPAPVPLPLPASVPKLLPEQIVFDLMDKGITSRRVPLDASMETYRPSFKHLLDEPAYAEPDDIHQQREEAFATKHVNYIGESGVKPFASRDNRGFGDSEYGPDLDIIQPESPQVSSVGIMLHGVYLPQDLPSEYEVPSPSLASDGLDLSHTQVAPPPPASSLFEPARVLPSLTPEGLDLLYSQFTSPPPASSLLEPAWILTSLTSEGLDLSHTRFKSPPPASSLLEPARILPSVAHDGLNILHAGYVTAPPVSTLPRPLPILPSQYTPSEVTRPIYISNAARPQPVSDQFAHMQGHLRQDAISGPVNIHGSGTSTFQPRLGDKEFLDEFFGSHLH